MDSSYKVQASALSAGTKRCRSPLSYSRLRAKLPLPPGAWMQPPLRVPGASGSTQVPCAEISCREGEMAETESRRWLTKDCHGEQGKEAAAGAGPAQALGTHTMGLSHPSPCRNSVAIVVLGYAGWLALLVLLHSLGTIF